MTTGEQTLILPPPQPSTHPNRPESPVEPAPPVTPSESAPQGEIQPAPSVASSENIPQGKIKPVPIAAPSENIPQGKIKPVSSVAARARNAKKDFTAPLGKRTQATFPIQKPLKSKYVRVHPGKEYRLARVLTYTDEDTGEIYYVSPDLELPGSVESRTKLTDLYASQAHDGTNFIWYVHHSDTSWFRAAKRAVRAATDNWRRVVARKSANTYDLYDPEDTIPEPDWSTLPPFMEMVESGFEDRLIYSNDHPVLRKLRGMRDDDE